MSINKIIILTLTSDGYKKKGGKMNQYSREDIIKGINRLIPFKYSEYIVVNQKRIEISEEFRPTIRKTIKTLDAIWVFGLILLLGISMIIWKYFENYTLGVAISFVYLVIQVTIFYWLKKLYFKKILPVDLMQILVIKEL